MVLKAYITEIPQSGNIFKVRIPYLEDNTGNEMIFSALLCNQPGMYGGYSVGDCVFVGFEGYKYSSPNNPVILGKLYTEQVENHTTQQVGTLTVHDKIQLPDDTKIGGYGFKDLFILSNAKNNSSNLSYVDQGEIPDGDTI